MAVPGKTDTGDERRKAEASAEIHDEQSSAALTRLGEALADQRAYLAGYERPSEPVVYETLRALDDLFCRELMELPQTLDKEERLYRSLSGWGVNQALRRIVPKTLDARQLRVFPSIDENRSRVDDFLFNCGTLDLAERYEGWLREGILTGHLRHHEIPDESGAMEVLLLRSTMASFFDEDIGRSGVRWASSLARARDGSRERRLENRHRKIARRMERHVELLAGWLVTYSSTREIDDYFFEWARLYLRRMQSQDIIGPDDVIGGRPFSRYVEVLTALSARSQKHLAFAGILKARHPSVHLRNLLTSHADRENFIRSLAEYMDADFGEMDDILASFVLRGDNLELHAKGGQTVWAPIVQASAHALLLPVYGLDINPFLFLFTELRARHEKDWFRIANNRERRWIEEIERLFEGARWQTHRKNLRLRAGGKDLTDIDFAVHDRKANELALLQLKWQQPVGMDNRLRRSAGRNLIAEGNRWIRSVSVWLDRHGSAELMRRLGFESLSSPTIQLFVLGRYHVHLTGFEGRDEGAVWSDWAHFHRTRFEKPKRSISQTASALRFAIDNSRAAKKGESIMFPVGDLSLILNPTSVPEQAEGPR